MLKTDEQIHKAQIGEKSREKIKHIIDQPEHNILENKATDNISIGKKYDSNNNHLVALCPKSQRFLRLLLTENPDVSQLLNNASDTRQVAGDLKQMMLQKLEANPVALKFYKREVTGRSAFEKLQWTDFGIIRILDYIDYAGKEYEDLNLRGKKVMSNPVETLWLAVNQGTGNANADFFEDMLHLFRQINGKLQQKKPTPDEVTGWMKRHPAGLDDNVIEIRKENRDRILRIIIEQIEQGEVRSRKFSFEDGLSPTEKFVKALQWWDNNVFHIHFAIRSPQLLNKMLNYSLTGETMEILEEAQKAGIPFFVNPYYLSLLDVRARDFAIGADLAIRDYVIYSKQLIEEFGYIVAWEKEDIVEPGKPNAAGWILPSHHNIHRRYPEVAILIPETVGRACGGLCASCQRMYDFQSGNLNFDLQKLEPKETWRDKLKRLMQYFEHDSQLRDILITGGDALMSSDKSMKELLDAVYQTAINKRKANENRKHGEKTAEIVRIRLGTRLPVYLPQRITPELTQILKDFKNKASKVGIKQFVIQTHFESAMEVTPAARLGIQRLISAGWTVTNQQVFTTAASRRGHTAKLRKTLNDIGVLTYYTFCVKGYKENSHSFATNARAMQEQLEEKVLGEIQETYYDTIRKFPLQAEKLVEHIDNLRNTANIPFLATDRNVLNLPGVGKSLTYRTIGITNDGRRILEFDHDATRNHSPIIHKMGKVIIIESKSMSEYLRQLDAMGEDINEYQSVFGYSIGETEPRMPVYEYPEYDYKVTKELTNLDIGE